MALRRQHITVLALMLVLALAVFAGSASVFGLDGSSQKASLEESR